MTCSDFYLVNDLCLYTVYTQDQEKLGGIEIKLKSKSDIYTPNYRFITVYV